MALVVTTVQKSIEGTGTRVVFFMLIIFIDNMLTLYNYVTT